MNETPDHAQRRGSALWMRALRLIPLILVLVASYWNILAALMIRPQFGQFVLDTNAPLSPAGRLLLDRAPLFLICAVVLPLAAFAVMFLRGNVRPFLIGTALLVISAGQFLFTMQTMVRTAAGGLSVGRPTLSR